MKIFSIQFLLLFNLSFLHAETSTLAHIFNASKEMPKNYHGATFINTDGILNPCTSNVDCYKMREPVFWCRLAKIQQWTDKGCYCDPILNACVIERKTKLGPITIIRNYAFCTWKESWECPSYL
ncbi:hypothetical protein LOAG_13630 [Loa loa]|uniref:Secreted protein n=1 Tax=Loa loa TaxID=7209 RepID=A0A1I7W363_LOALO|nr:hypothetical protein LOAG_13630 [Loa loa]EFO14886.2 hypothetical protein LOAG_13630 [Loa loa]